MKRPPIFPAQGSVASLAPAVLLALAATAVHAATVDGDLGLGLDYLSPPTRFSSSSVSLVPYAFLDYGRAFIRVDTAGLRTVPFGVGYLELAARFNRDGFDTTAPALQGQHSRQDTVPVGLSTWQETPAGVFYATALRDPGPAHGNAADLTWGLRFRLAGLSFYPLLTVEYRNAAAVAYAYGTVATAALPAYLPSGTHNTTGALVIERELWPSLVASLYLKDKRLGAAIRDSPLDPGPSLREALFSLSWRSR